MTTKPEPPSEAEWLTEDYLAKWEPKATYAELVLIRGYRTLRAALATSQAEVEELRRQAQADRWKHDAEIESLRAQVQTLAEERGAHGREYDAHYAAWAAERDVLYAQNGQLRSQVQALTTWNDPTQPPKKPEAVIVKIEWGLDHYLYRVGTWNGAEWIGFSGTVIGWRRIEP